jgi:hypothetical protein
VSDVDGTQSFIIIVRLEINIVMDRRRDRRGRDPGRPRKRLERDPEKWTPVFRKIAL